MPDTSTPRAGFGAVPPDVAQARREAREREQQQAREDTEHQWQMVRRYSLASIGLLLFGFGFYFLLIQPSNGDEVAGVGAIANLHRLTLGETFTVTAAIFCGFAWRPKA
jgi:hypothetical protein